MTDATQIARYEDQSIDPGDELFHPIGTDPSWSESYYFYYFDPTHEIGGYTRLGFRPHDGWKDAVHMLFLEGTRIGFSYERQPHAPGDERVDVGASQLAMEKPFGQWRIDFDGDAQDCPDGRVLVTPRKQRAEGWYRPSRARLSLDYQSVGPPFYAERAVAGGHFEQPGSARGELQVGERVWPFQGWGLRDKSWGPRPWTDQTGAGGRSKTGDSPFGQGKGWRVFGIWLTAVIQPELAFAVAASPTPDGGMRSQGYVCREGRNHQIREISVETSYDGESLFHRRNRFRARFDDGSSLSAEGEVLNHGPSKVAQPGGATIVNAGMTRFHLDTGERGLGISEYWSSVTLP